MIIDENYVKPDYSWQENHPILSWLIIILLAILAIPYLLLLGLWFIIKCIADA